MRTGFANESDLEEDAGGYHGLYWGTVTDNVDPRKLGRVKVHVPGITVKETDWAYPIGMPGAGSAASEGGKGGFFVPRVKATVIVAFIFGKIEQPIFWPAHYSLVQGAPGTPRVVQAQTAEDAPNVRVLQETESFEIYILEKADEKKLVIQTLGGENMIELDAIDGSIAVRAKRTIVVDAPTVSIDGLNVTIKGRPVSPLGLDI